MVLTHFTLTYFRLSPHTCSWALQEEGPAELEPRGLAGRTEGWQSSAGDLAIPQPRVWLQDNSVSEVIALKTPN